VHDLPTIPPATTLDDPALLCHAFFSVPSCRDLPSRPGFHLLSEGSLRFMPNRVCHPADWAVVSRCFSLRLSATQLPSAAYRLSSSSIAFRRVATSKPGSTSTMQWPPTRMRISPLTLFALGSTDGHRGIIERVSAAVGVLLARMLVMLLGIIFTIPATGLTWPWQSLVLLMGVVLGGMVASTLASARRLARIRVVEALREL